MSGPAQCTSMHCATEVFSGSLRDVSVPAYLLVTHDSDVFTFQSKIPLSQFYPYIRCALCCGFLIDATTITECLHTCE